MRAVLGWISLFTVALAMIITCAMSPFQDWDTSATEVDATRVLVVSVIVACATLLASLAFLILSLGQSANANRALLISNTGLALVMIILWLVKWFPRYQG